MPASNRCSVNIFRLIYLSNCFELALSAKLQYTQRHKHLQYIRVDNEILKSQLIQINMRLPY